MMHRLVLFLPRRRGHKWLVQKLHDLVHLPMMLEMLGASDNFDASHGERHLKDFFKVPAETSQQRGTKIFAAQTASNMQDLNIMRKSGMRTRYFKEQENDKPAIPSIDDGRLSFDEVFVDERTGIQWQRVGKTGAVAHYRINYCPARCACSAVWVGKREKTTKGGRPPEIHPVVLSWFTERWRKIFPEGQWSVDCYTELTTYTYSLPRTQDSSIRELLNFRAHPDFRGEGPMYDYAATKFDHPTSEDVLVPSKILCLYRAANDMFGTPVNPEGEEKLFVLVHPTEFLEGQGTSIERTAKLLRTNLAERYVLATKRRSGGRTIPDLYSMPWNSIEESINIVEESPGIYERYDKPPKVWFLLSKDEWWRNFVG